MSRIAYDPVKDKFSKIISNSCLLRRVFYFLLDLFFLRSWHLRRLIRKYGRAQDQKGEWSLLDAGSGFGQYDRFILSSFKNVEVLSVDVKKDYLADCRNYFSNQISNGRIEFREADLLNFEPDRRFDLAICIDVLEHIEEDVRVMQNLNKSLKQGGVLLIHSPSHYSEEDADEDESFVDEHARAGYSKEEISEKLVRAGFDVETVHYTYGFWGHKAWILSVKWPMLWFNKLSLLAALPLIFYYPLILPFTLLMNTADLFTKNQKGNGIYAVGRKSVS